MGKYDLNKYNTDFNDEKYDEAKRLAEEKKSGLGWAQFAAGIGDALQKKSPSNSAEQFGKIRDGIEDSTVGDYLRRKKSAADEIDTQKKLALNDPNSNESLSFRKMMERSFPDVAKTYGEQWANVTAADKENIFQPLQLRENIDARKQSAAILAGERAQNRLDKQEEKKRKDAELSVAQAKQLGLYKSGKTAEEQFLEATKDPNDFDPTSIGQIIDNSGWAPAGIMNNNANKARSAKSAWVEVFLRDASGAAIPPSERLAYAEDYFPMPGDSKEVVANKAALRQQKMENARVGSGDTSMLAEQPQAPKKEVVKTQTNQKTGEKRVIYSDGTFEVLPATAGR